MSDEKTLEILKSALLLEIRGKAFYQKAAETARNDSVKQFFKAMVAEEESHVKLLSEQYREVRDNRKLLPNSFADFPENVADKVLSSELKKHIQAAGFEAAAISAAMGMEERAIKLYTTRAGETNDSEEEKLYRWLADWETNHLELLSELEKDVTEAIWNDNNFWPF